ncbi:MAG TPA: cohesin domain-containing protein [Candidatus Paceibacterota bacterium]|nr:cohesin domain-containing protein [Candidatus Paceibacterota bacterium]
MKQAFILSLLAFALPVVAQASSIGLAPQATSVTPGQTITVTVAIDPAGKTLTAVKAAIDYPADLLTPTSFSFGPNWVGMTQAGYDQMGGGEIIKTAGYPSGTSAEATFGTITFTAKAAGVATIAVDRVDSIAYDTNTVDTLTGTQGTARIVIAEQTPAEQGIGAAPQSNNIAGPVTVPARSVSSGASQASAATTAVATSTATSSLEAAAAAAAGISIPAWVWALIALLVIIALAAWYWLSRRKA